MRTTTHAAGVDMSWRTQVGAGADSQIAGFVIAGEGTKKIVVRAVGRATAWAVEHQDALFSAPAGSTLGAQP